MTDAVIVSTARTGLGKSWKGAFNMTYGATLGAHSVRHAVARAGIDPAEVEHPAWMVKWADASANLSSRQALIKAALQENALLLAAHMLVGQVEGTVEHPRWASI